MSATLYFVKLCLFQNSEKAASLIDEKTESVEKHQYRSVVLDKVVISHSVEAASKSLVGEFFRIFLFLYMFFFEKISNEGKEVVFPLIKLNDKIFENILFEYFWSPLYQRKNQLNFYCKHENSFSWFMKNSRNNISGFITWKTRISNQIEKRK